MIDTYFFLASTLKAADQQAILSQLKTLAFKYNTYGISAFQREVEENVKYRKINQYCSALLLRAPNES